MISNHSTSPVVYSFLALLAAVGLAGCGANNTEPPRHNPFDDANSGFIRFANFSSAPIACYDGKGLISESLDPGGYSVQRRAAPGQTTVRAERGGQTLFEETIDVTQGSRFTIYAYLTKDGTAGLVAPGDERKVAETAIAVRVVNLVPGSTIRAVAKSTEEYVLARDLQGAAAGEAIEMAPGTYTIELFEGDRSVGTARLNGEPEAIYAVLWARSAANEAPRLRVVRSSTSTKPILGVPSGV
jgi:hypothetical protein